MAGGDEAVARRDDEMSIHQKKKKAQIIWKWGDAKMMSPLTWDNLYFNTPALITLKILLYHSFAFSLESDNQFVLNLNANYNMAKVSWYDGDTEECFSFSWNFIFSAVLQFFEGFVLHTF